MCAHGAERLARARPALSVIARSPDNLRNQLIGKEFRHGTKRLVRYAG